MCDPTISYQWLSSVWLLLMSTQWRLLVLIHSSCHTDVNAAFKQAIYKVTLFLVYGVNGMPWASTTGWNWWRNDTTLLLEMPNFNKQNWKARYACISTSLAMLNVIVAIKAAQVWRGVVFILGSLVLCVNRCLPTSVKQWSSSQPH